MKIVRAIETTKRTLVHRIGKKQLKYLGQIMRKYCLKNITFTERNRDREEELLICELSLGNECQNMKERQQKDNG